ncbi:MAG: NAD-dependent epimerase/dehydratase family protein [Nitrospirae bacterium]|nr:NAD-dependent epimerase/dehydratase family protein [Candidatus Manganitrophaceae bacterium]
MINGAGKDRPVLITGGAGFIGTNLAHRLLEQGRSVIVFDNLSRAGVEENLQWLRKQHHAGLEVEIEDIRNLIALRRSVARAGAVFHFAAQVAVTTSLTEPIHDFEVNARGTLNLLEAIRAQPEPPSLLFTSTNKVYGALEDLPLRNAAKRYAPQESTIRAHGVGEDRPLHFHSPYGCSKGAADQYVLDYARTYGLPAVVFRMSCIYGPHQFGTEDQGWVAHFLIRAIENETITLYGDGKQVRDLLFIEDLVDAFLAVEERIDFLSGEAFNIGGGPANAISLLELVEQIGALRGKKPSVQLDAWRRADQRYYVSDTRKFQAATGWVPRTDVEKGIEALHEWLLAFRSERSALKRPRSVSKIRLSRTAERGAA